MKMKAERRKPTRRYARKVTQLLRENKQLTEYLHKLMAVIAKMKGDANDKSVSVDGNL